MLLAYALVVFSPGFDTEELATSEFFGAAWLAAVRKAATFVKLGEVAGGDSCSVGFFRAVVEHGSAHSGEGGGLKNRRWLGRGREAK